MSMTTIKVSCIDQRLILTSGPVIASGGRNEDAVEFNFSPLWDGFDKTATFYRSREKAYHVPITDNQCVIPHEVLADEGQICFGVFGVKGDVTRTTEIMKYRVLEGALTTDTNPSDPTPDIYSELVNRIVSVENRATAIEQFTTQPVPYETTGDLVQIENFAGMPMNCVTAIEPIQPGSGDPSLDNVRPISGRTNAVLVRCGKNLVDMADFYSSNSTVYIEQSANSLRIYTDSAGTYRGARTPAMHLIGGKTYTLSASVAEIVSGNVRIGLRDAQTNTFLNNSSCIFTTTGFKKATFTVNEDVDAYVSPLVTWSTSENGDATFSNIQLEISNTATNFEPFTGEDFSVTFNDTIYGGTLDWNTGVLTVDKLLKTITGEENVTWKNNTGWVDGTWYCGTILPGAEEVVGFGTVADIMCSHAPVTTPGLVAITENCVGYGNGTNLYANFGNRYNTAELFTDYLAAQYAAGTPVQVCYKLASPTVIQLTPNDIIALSGLNTVYSNAGKTTVSGRKDILWLTSSLIQRIQALESAVISLGGNV